MLYQTRTVVAAHGTGFGVTFGPPALCPAIAVLMLTPNRPAADRAEAPSATAAATRSRKSPEYGAGISSPNDMLCHHYR